MKKILLALTILFIAPLTVSAYEIQTDFDHDKCELIVTGTQEGHEASVSYYDSNDEFLGMKTGTIDNGNYEARFVLKYEQDTTIKIVVVNEESENRTEKANEVVPACNIEHQDEPDNPGPIGNHTVSFVTNGGTEISDVIIPDGDKVERPDDPEKEGFTFGGWYEDSTFEHPFDFEIEIHEDREIYARWIANDDLYEYVYVDDETGNMISFTEEKNLNFSFSFVDILTLTPEQFELATKMPADSFDLVKEQLTELLKENGTMLAVYGIDVTKLAENPDDNQDKHDGPFIIKIKITEEMKKYDTFKLVYLDQNENGMFIEDVVTLTVDGDYLVGTLPHLSAYALTGSNTGTTDNPKTNDNIMLYVELLIIATFGLSMCGVLKYNNE